MAALNTFYGKRLEMCGFRKIKVVSIKRIFRMELRNLRYR